MTNTSSASFPTTVTGDLGVSPGTAVTGFPPGVVIGAIHAGDSVAAQAQLDLTVAFNNAAGRSNPAAIPADIGGTTIVAGVYKPPVSLAITGNVTLDGGGNPNAVFIFQIPSSTLTANTGSTVTLVNRANACNVFWQVGSSATLNGPSFSGNVFAYQSISVGGSVIVNGRLLAQNGGVTLISDTVTKPGP